MPNLSLESPDNYFVFFIVPREALCVLVANSGVESGELLLEKKVWRQYCSQFSHFRSRRIAIACVEELAKALFLRWTWEALGWSGKGEGELAKLVDQLIGGPNMKLETFDRYWEMTTFHGTDDCQNALRRLAEKSPESVNAVRRMISEDAASWIGCDRPGRTP